MELYDPPSTLHDSVISTPVPVATNTAVAIDKVRSDMTKVKHIHAVQIVANMVMSVCTNSM